MKYLNMLFLFLMSASASSEELYNVEPVTPPRSFTPGIEGPACDRAGNIYAVNFRVQGTVGRVTP